MSAKVRVGIVVVAAGLLAALGIGACGNGGGESRDGWTSIATGDTAGEWELFAEYDDGEWTGCLRLDHFGTLEECADPDGDDLVTFESGEGATFGAVPAGAGLEFDDGDEVSLIDGRFFVVASEADVPLAG